MSINILKAESVFKHNDFICLDMIDIIPMNSHITGSAAYRAWDAGLMRGSGDSDADRSENGWAQRLQPQHSSISMA